MDAEGVLIASGLLQLDQKNKYGGLTFIKDLQGLRRLMSLDGQFSLNVTEKGDCELYLHRSKHRLVTLGALPWADGQRNHDSILRKRSSPGRKNEQLSTNLDGSATVFFHAGLGRLALVDRTNSSRIIVKRFTRDELLVQSSGDFMVATSVPITVATLGTDYRYQITAFGRGGHKCELVSCPATITVAA